MDLLGEILLLKLDSLNGCQTNALNISQEVIGMLLGKKHKIDKSYRFVLLVVTDNRAGLSGLILDPHELGSCFRPVDGLLFHLQPLPADKENVQTIWPPPTVCTALTYTLFSLTAQ